MDMSNQVQRRCGHYHADVVMQRCYIQCWPFDAWLCSLCGDVGCEWGPVKIVLFAICISWWWTGKVRVRGGE